MSFRRQQSRDEGQEFRTKSGMVGWIDVSPRGYPSLELSLFSRIQLARENLERTYAMWREYLK